MRKKLSALVFHFLILASIETGLAQEQITSVAREIKASVVSITTYDRKGKPLGRGTGLMVGTTGDVLTSRKLFEDVYRAEIRNQNGESYPVTDIIIDRPELNLIRYKVDGPPSKSSPFKDFGLAPNVGQQLFAVSISNSSGPDAIEGIVASIKDEVARRTIKVKGVIPETFLGSPVINDKGQFVGVVVSLNKDTFDVSGGQDVVSMIMNYGGGSILPPVPIRRVTPEIPSEARRARITGSVTVEILIDESGKVVSAKAKSGHYLLHEAAEKAALGWKFRPAKDRGKPVKVHTSISFNFHY